jgi:hypothetical protein
VIEGVDDGDLVTSEVKEQTCNDSWVPPIASPPVDRVDTGCSKPIPEVATLSQAKHGRLPPVISNAAREIVYDPFRSADREGRRQKDHASCRSGVFSQVLVALRERQFS